MHKIYILDKSVKQEEERGQEGQKSWQKDENKSL